MFKSFRKSLSLVLIMVIVLTLTAPAAFASETSAINYEEIIDEINKTNDYIYKTISETQKKAEKEIIKAKNEQDLNKTIDKLIEKLIEKTEKAADKLIEKALKVGIELEKNYIEVTIYDRIVLIDPFYMH